jgi:hypothetical protein
VNINNKPCVGHQYKRYDKIGKIDKGGNNEKFVHDKLSRQYSNLKMKLTSSQFGVNNTIV